MIARALRLIADFIPRRRIKITITLIQNPEAVEGESWPPEIWTEG
jgi:hypothetical protein